MSNAIAPLQPALTEHSLSERILALAAQGLKPRDISALLGVHPMLVIRVLETSGGWVTSGHRSE